MNNDLFDKFSEGMLTVQISVDDIPNEINAFAEVIKDFSFPMGGDTREKLIKYTEKYNVIYVTSNKISDYIFYRNQTQHDEDCEKYDRYKYVVTLPEFLSEPIDINESEIMNLFMQGENYD